MLFLNIKVDFITYKSLYQINFYNKMIVVYLLHLKTKTQVYKN